jgi:hypothetical protein
MIERTPGEKAARHLQRIVGREPLYRPAAFTLGYLRLREGDTAEAERLFAGLTETYNKEADLRFTAAKEKFPRTSLKYGLILTWIKPVGRRLLPWLEQWQHIESLLNGGRLYRAAQDWRLFDEHLARFKDAKKKNNIFEQASFQVYLGGFPDMAGIRKRARIASGLEAGDETQARNTLKWLLSAEKISDLDQQLWRLELSVVSGRVESSTRDVHRSLGDESTAAMNEPRLPDLEALKQSDIVRSLGWLKGLDEFRMCWEAEDWDRCQKLLRDLRDYTREPDDSEATTQLKTGSGPAKFRRLREWSVRKFFPAFALLDPWRDTFRNGFFLESEYYLALSRYRTFTGGGIRAAMKQAEELHTRILGGAVPTGIDRGRYAELRVLAQCLEVDAVLRILLGDESDLVIKDSTLEAEVRWDALRQEVLPMLRRIVKDANYTPGLRAEVSCTLGLIERYTRKPIRIDKAAKLMAEFDCYREALKLERSADACFYLAEALLEAGRAAEASAHLDEALRQCPRHAGALDLRKGLNSPPVWAATRTVPGQQTMASLEQGPGTP